MVVIANPMSAYGRSRGIAERVAAALRAHGCRPTLLFTEHPGHAADLARRHAGESDLLLAVGGDGTYREVAAGLLEAEGPVPDLGIIPAGRGNDLARTLGIATDPRVAVQQALDGSQVLLDVGWVEEPRAPFLGVAGCGFDSRVVARMASGRWPYRGRTGYTFGVLAEVARLRPVPMRVRVDDAVFDGDALLVAIGNTPSYGGGMRIAPHADPTDGLLDVVIVRAVGRLRLLRIFPRVFAGSHVDLPEVTVLRGRRVTLEPSAPLPMLLDGDLVGTAPATITVQPGALRVRVPREGALPLTTPR